MSRFSRKESSEEDRLFLLKIEQSRTSSKHRTFVRWAVSCCPRTRKRLTVPSLTIADREWYLLEPLRNRLRKSGHRKPAATTFGEPKGSAKKTKYEKLP